MALALLLYSASVPAIASAQSEPGAIRLSADLYVLDVWHLPQASYTSLRLGLMGASFGIGAQLTDELTVGSRFEMRFSFIEDPSRESYSDADIGVLPYFEYMLPDSDISPFVGVQVGLSAYFPEGEGSGGDPQLHFRAGAFTGIRFFATPAISISPQIKADFIYSSYSRLLPGVESLGLSALITLDGFVPTGL